MTDSGPTTPDDYSGYTGATELLEELQRVAEEHWRILQRQRELIDRLRRELREAQ